MKRITCRGAIEEIFAAETSVLKTREVIERLHALYPDDPWKSNTISAHLIGLSVNHTSSMHYPNFRRHGSLFSLGDGRYRKWNPAEDGSWAVIDGRVQRVDSGGNAARPIHKAANAINVREPTARSTYPLVTVDDLTRWRRGVLRILAKVSRPLDREGVGTQIRRLSRNGQVPREVASLMTAIAEMRNVSEYQNKRLSHAESEAVRHAWKAVTEWALGQGLDFKDRPD